jgi:alpha-D-xyloside xylohydrolase
MKLLNLLIFSLFTLSACNSDRFASLEVDETTNYVSLNLLNKASHDLVFSSNDTSGGIFYNTAQGRGWLKGNPDSLFQDSEKFYAKWTSNNRVIAIEIKKDGLNYDLKFSATPSSGVLGWGIRLLADPEEYFTGLMERVVDGDQRNSWKEDISTGMNLRGERVTMLVEPTLGLYSPFYYSSAGYGLFVKGTWPGLYDFCANEKNIVNIEFEGPEFEAIIYISSNPASIISQHTLTLGPSLLPPEWAFRPIRWRDDHANLENYYDGSKANPLINSMVAEDILMMEYFDIPCGAYWFDRPWAKGKLGYDDFTWDEERFPNPSEMLDWLHEKNINPLIWIAPWVSGNMAQVAKEKKYNIPATKYAPGEHQSWQYSNNLELIDFTNDSATQWWQNEGLRKLLEQGIKGFKLDRADEMVPYEGDIIYANGKTAREMRNAFPVYYLKATHDIAKEIHGDDFLLLARAGYSGSSKYGSFWGGDIATSENGLRAAIIAVQRASVIGFSIWGSDIGGYWQGRMNSELTSRWLAFGCFNPIMEFGPTENTGPWNMPTEPSYDTSLIATWRLYATLHDEISSYSYQLAKEYVETGMPIVRPLFLEYPDDPESWENWNTFTYGNDILVYSIYKKDTDSVNVWLPTGANWIDAWNNEEVYKGGQYIKVNTPLYKIPIFIKEESKLEFSNLQSLYYKSVEKASQKPDLESLSMTIFDN